MITFIYAIIGMFLFGHVRLQGALDDMVNFQTFGMYIIQQNVRRISQRLERIRAEILEFLYVYAIKIGICLRFDVTTSDCFKIWFEK